MKPRTDTAQADANMTHREYFAELTDERLEWTPLLDECLHTYFQLLFNDTENLVDAIDNYGRCMGIAYTLRAAGLITQRQCAELDGFSAYRTHAKCRLWNGCEITVSVSQSHPDHTAPSTLQ